MQFALVGERILLTLWVGGMWAIGYIAAPTLFAMLDDRKMAGEVAGQMFAIISYTGLVCGSLLLVSVIRRLGFQWRAWLLVFMLILVACGQFVLQPMMGELKLQGLVTGSAQAKQFGILHGVASIIYLITSVSGLILTIFGFVPGSEDTDSNSPSSDKGLNSTA